MTRLAQQQCLLFYNEMASIFLGLFENGQKYSAYGLHVLYMSEDETLEFSSVLGTGITQFNTNDWIAEKQVMTSFRLASLRYLPYIISHHQAIAPKKDTIEEVFSQRYGDAMHCKSFKVHSGKFEVYFVLAQNSAIKALPTMLDTLFDMSITQWRDCFNNGEKLGELALPDSSLLRPLDGNANIMIQSRSDYLAESCYFATITDISAQYYERSKSNGTIVITKTQEQQLTIPIEEIPFACEYARQLRKLLEMTRNDFSLLVHNGKVYGVGMPRRPNTIFRITGHMEWEMRDVHNEVVLRYVSGSYYVPIALEMQDWYIEQRVRNIEEKHADVIQQIIASVRVIGHGSLLIFTDIAKKEVQRLCKKRRGFRLTNTIDLFDDCSNNAGKVLKSLTSIDGAVFVDMSGYCHGFGIILDGDAVAVGTPARGSRYNSAMNYVKRYSKGNSCMYAVVYSDDGTLDILSAGDG